MAAEAASARRAAYVGGVIAAGDALMADLDWLGALDDAEQAPGQDDPMAICSVCTLRRMGYSSLADRLEFAFGVARAGTG